MRVLVIGGGGREHALAWKLRQSPRVTEIFCAPGNGGICEEAECIRWDGKDLDSLLALAAKLEPALTVVGPELPLSLGVVDEFTARGLRIFGPTRAAAQLESSKAFAKHFMQRHNIPTAKYAACTTAEEVTSALGHFTSKVVVKADGLAAGKGVVIADSKEEAASVAAEMLAGRLVGQAGGSVVLEEFLEGEELSFLVLSDGENLAPLAAAQDHKRIGEGDTGANTGGMGAYSTPALLDDAMREWLLTHVARPVVAGMAAEGVPYKGVLYCGLMMTARGPQVLEFNCRFGDPETQPILMRLESDLLDHLDAAVHGRLHASAFRWTTDAAACVVLASAGYPGDYQNGKVISGLPQAAALEGVKVFHAGTKRAGAETVTAGGRVLGVTARAASLAEALQRAYQACDVIRFDGMQFRRDIGARAMKR